MTDSTKLLDGGGEPTSAAPSQNASRWRRYGTWVVDTILHSIILFILYGIIIGLSVKMGAVPKKILTNKWLIYPLSYTTYVFYYIICEGFFKTTPGKRFCGTRIIRVGPDGIPDAPPISFAQAIIRTLCRLIPLDPFSVLLRSSRLGWHDTIAGTAVINADIENRSSFFDRFFTLGIVVAVPVFLFLLFQQELSVSTSVSQSLWVEGRLRVVEAPDISEAERTQLRDTVRELGLQLVQLPRSEPWQPWRASKKVVRNQVLIVLLNDFVRGNKLTREEYDQWMKWVDSRDTLDINTLLRARRQPVPEKTLILMNKTYENKVPAFSIAIPDEVRWEIRARGNSAAPFAIFRSNTSGLPFISSFIDLRSAMPEDIQKAWADYPEKILEHKVANDREFEKKVLPDAQYISSTKMTIAGLPALDSVFKSEKTKTSYHNVAVWFPEGIVSLGLNASTTSYETDDADFRAILSGLRNAPLSNEAAGKSGEAYQATVGGHQIRVPFSTGITKISDDPVDHRSSYRFIMIDRATGTPKLSVDIQLRAYEPGEKNIAEATRSFESIIRKDGFTDLVERLKVLPLDDINPAFHVYWPPYYHLATQKPETPFMIYKLTILTNKDSSVGLSVNMMGLLPFKEATKEDIKIAEGLMDEMLVSIVREATVN